MFQIQSAAAIRFMAAWVLTSASIAAPAWADSPLVMHSGEWESRIGGNPPRHICLKTDRAFDPATLTKMTERVGAKCTIGEVNTTGSVITYITACDIAGGKMILHGTITVDGPESYSSRSQSHFEGGAIKLPDMDLTVASHRLGDCQPGDIQSPF